MTFAALVTIVGALLTVLVLAGYLIYVALVLYRVARRLNAINAGIVSINEKAGPITPVLTEINRDLAGVDKALHTVLTKERAPKAAPPPKAAPAQMVAPAPMAAPPRPSAPTTRRATPTWKFAERKP